MKPPDLRVVWARSAPVEEVRALPWMAQNFAASKPEEVEKEQEKVWLLQRTAPPHPGSDWEVPYLPLYLALKSLRSPLWASREPCLNFPSPGSRGSAAVCAHWAQTPPRPQCWVHLAEPLTCPELPGAGATIPAIRAKILDGVSWVRTPGLLLSQSRACVPVPNGKQRRGRSTQVPALPLFLYEPALSGLLPSVERLA